jgi:hypothetical protein
VELSDRRAEPRNPELLWGKAIFKDVAKDCVINDLSTSGARLRLTAFAALPDKFDLFIFETRRTYKAAVQWRAGDQAGVVFEQVGDIDDTLSRRSSTACSTSRRWSRILPPWWRICAASGRRRRADRVAGC